LESRNEHIDEEHRDMGARCFTELNMTTP